MATVTTTHAAPGGQKFRNHAQRAIDLSGEAQIPAGDTRLILMETSGFATLFAEIVCDVALTVVLSEGWSAAGPWVQVDSFTSSGDPADPDQIDRFCQRPWAKLALTNGTGGATTDLALYARKSTAVGVA